MPTVANLELYWFCGGAHHLWKEYPAKDNTCYSYQKKRHYASICHSKNRELKQLKGKLDQKATVHAISENYAFLEAVTSDRD